MKVLVTGAGGFIGSRVYFSLREAGVAVTGTTRRPAAGLTRCDLAQPAAASKLIGKLRPEVIVHAAGELVGNDPDGEAAAYFNNVISTANVLAAAVRARIKRLLFFSSNQVYGDGYRVRAGFESEGAPRQLHGRGKLVCERMLADHAESLEVLVLRLPAVVDPGKKGGDVATDLARELKQKGTATLFGRGSARRQFVDARDLSSLVPPLLKKRSWGARFSVVPIAGPPMTIKEIAETLISANGRGRLVLDRSRPEPADQWVDPTLLKKRLGLELATPAKTTLRDVMRSNGAPRGSAGR